MINQQSSVGVQNHLKGLDNQAKKPRTNGKAAVMGAPVDPQAPQPNGKAEIMGVPKTSAGPQQNGKASIMGNGLLSGGYQSIATPVSADPKIREVQAEELASNQLDKILSKDSPLMQRAQTQGKQYSASRGLLNGSLGAETSMGAMVDRATPLAQQDSARYGQVYDNNLGFENQFGLQKNEQNFTAGESALNRGHDLTLQSNQFGENANQRKWQSGENSADRTLSLDMQGNQFDFQRGENASDRALSEKLQTLQNEFVSAQSELDRAQANYQQDKSIEAQKALQDAQNTFAGVQAELDRTQQLTVQDRDIEGRLTIQEAQNNFAAAQSELDRALAKYQTDKSLESQKELQTAQNNFSAAQADLDRAQQSELQSSDQTWRTGEAQAERQFQSGESQEQRDFAGTQADLDRQQQLTVQIADAKNKIEQMGYAFNLDQYNVSKEYAANQASGLMNSIANVQANPDLEPEAKRVAIQNLIDNTNQALEMGATLFNTPLPSFAAPGSAPTVINPNPSYNYQSGPSATSQQLSSSVDTLYQDLLGRTPDSGAMNHWIQQAQQNGWTEQQLREAIIDSAYQGGGQDAEYLQQNGIGTDRINQQVPIDTNAIASFYQNTLGREPEAGAVEYWQNQAKENGWTQEQLMQAMNSAGQIEIAKKNKATPSSGLSDEQTARLSNYTLGGNGVLPSAGLLSGLTAEQLAALRARYA